MGERSDLPLPHATYRLHVVLVGTQHPGNLGAVCRSLLNHGFDSLRLVNPQCHPDDLEARNRAKHAGRVLDTCRTFNTLEEAIEDCSLVVGTSGKREIGDKVVYVHYYAHTLNLVLSDSAGIALDAAKLFDQLESLYLLFSRSEKIKKLLSSIK